MGCDFDTGPQQLERAAQAFSIFYMAQAAQRRSAAL